MFRKCTSILAAALVLLSVLPGAAGALQVDSGAVYCFSPEDFPGEEPLAGICILERGSADRIWPVSPAEALSMLQKQAYCPLDEGKHRDFLRLVDRLAQNVPLWRMECTKSPQAAQTAWDAMHP